MTALLLAQGYNQKIILDLYYTFLLRKTVKSVTTPQSALPDVWINVAKDRFHQNSIVAGLPGPAEG